MRIPPKYADVTSRRRFATGAAPEIHETWLNEERARAAREQPVPDPTTSTFDEFAGLWTSGRLAELYPGHVKAKRASLATSSESNS